MTLTNKQEIENKYELFRNSLIANLQLTKDLNNTYLIYGDKSYSVRDLINEISNNTETGINMMINIFDTLIEYLNRKNEITKSTQSISSNI